MTAPATLETDVLIAGGGPCGLMLANELGRRGVRCLVVDRKPGTAFNPQANATQARTMEHFRRLGFAHRVRAQGLPADHPTDVAYLTRLAGHEMARLRLPTAAQATQMIRGLGGSWSAAELPHRVSQKFVEVVLRDEAQALPGVDLRYGWELRGFSDTGAGITAEVAPVEAAGATRPGLTVQARWLVGADGARSSVRARLGIEWEGGSGFKRSFMGGRMLAVYLKAPDFYRLNPNDRAWMYVQVHPAQRSFIMSVDGVSEFAFHTQLADDTDVDALLLGMGERYDVIVTAGDGVFPLVASAEGKNAVARALLSTAAGSSPPPDYRPAELNRRVGTVDTFAATTEVQLPSTSDLALHARLSGAMMRYDWAINGRPYDQHVPLTIQRGQRATLTFANASMMFHPMHLHGHTFQVIKADGSAGPRKDTVIVRPMQTVTVRFGADNWGVWMLHCHNGYHMDAGMMTTLQYTG